MEQIAAAVICNRQVRPADTTVPRSLSVVSWGEFWVVCVWSLSMGW